MFMRTSEGHLETCQRSVMELLRDIVNEETATGGVP